MCLNEPQLSTIVYRQLEALLMFFLRLSGRLIPAHLVGCLVDIGGHTNGYGKNLIFLQGGALKDGNQIGVCGRPYGWVYPRIYLASEILPRQWVHPIHKVWGHRHKPGPPLACRQEVPVHPPAPHLFSTSPSAPTPSADHSSRRMSGGLCRYRR